MKTIKMLGRGLVAGVVVLAGSMTLAAVAGAAVTGLVTFLVAMPVVTWVVGE